jgi:hypothetical protein
MCSSHWPHCNWCNKSGAVHLVHGPNATDSAGSDSPPPSESGNPDVTDAFPDSGPDEGGVQSEAVLDTVTQGAISKRQDVASSHRRASRIRHSSSRNVNREVVISPEYDSDSSPVSVDDVVSLSDIPVGGPPPLPALPPIELSPDASATLTSQRTNNGTPAPAQAPTKTQKGGRSSCTPSPTSSIAPSTSWCSYRLRY